MSDEADRYMAAVDSLDPKLCEQYGHVAYTVTLCDRCGAELWLHPSEGSS